MYDNLEIFKSKLTEYIPLSATENSLYKTMKKEHESLQRLLRECEKRGLDFRRNITNGNATDGYINDFKIQGKYRSKWDYTRPTIQIKKFGGTFNGKKLKSAYEEKDFQYLVIEIGGPVDDPEKYHGYFCIIPMEILLERGAIRTETCDGKLDLNIQPPDYPHNHWTKPYWNNFSVFK
jgi:hypothetical protein